MAAISVTKEESDRHHRPKRSTVTLYLSVAFNQRSLFTRLLRWLLAPMMGIILLYVWTHVAESGRYPAFLLPHPDDVWSRMQTLHEQGRLMNHIKITGREALTGLLVSVLIALPLGYLVARNRWFSALVMPYLVAVRAIPVVAIAVIIIILFGTGIKGKVVIVALITWFPLMEATVVGIQSVDSQLRVLMRSYQANPWQVFRKLELPAAMPNVLSGLKVSATLAVVGAAVGELVSSNQGLAYLIMYGRTTSDAPMVFGGVILLTVLSLLLYGAIAFIESILLTWRRAL